MKLSVTISILALTLASASPVWASPDAAIAAAEKARQAAAAVGYEWRDTESLIKQARELALQGKSDDAIARAKAAEAQGKAALAQYQSEQKRYQSMH